MAGTETTEAADWAELGRSSSSLLRDVSRVHADKPVFRVSKVYICLLFVDLDLWMDDYTVVIYKRLNSPDMTHDTQEEL